MNHPSPPVSDQVVDLEILLQDTLKGRTELKNKIAVAEANLGNTQQLLQKKQSGFLNRLFVKKETVEELLNEVEERKQAAEELTRQLAAMVVHMDDFSTSEDREIFQQVISAFRDMCGSKKIWSIVLVKENTETKSSAANSVDRHEVKCSLRELELIRSSCPALYFQESNGNDFYIYAAGIVHFNGKEIIRVSDFSDVEFMFRQQLFIEPEVSMPSDSKIVDYAWNKVNKDGSPDLRFKGNFKTPVVKYGYLRFSFLVQEEEIFHCSNFEAAERFAKSFEKYLGRRRGTELKTTDTMSRTGLSEFGREYYYLLKEFSGQLEDIWQKLAADHEFIEKFADNLENVPADQFLAYCISYDLSHLAKMIDKGKLSQHTLEAAGAALLVTKLMTLNDNDFINTYDYDTLALSYTEGKIDGLIGTMKNLTENNNPLTINITKTDDGKVTSSSSMKSLLSLPAALKIINHDLFDEYATTLYRFASIISKADNSVSREEEQLLKEIYQVLHHPLHEEKHKTVVHTSGEESLKDILNELNALIGLEEVKKEINTLVNFINIQKAREASGLKSANLSYHIVFTGNPGTGKTTVARIVAKIYKSLGILKQGQIVETDRSGLIAEYVGQTAVKVNKLVDSAIGGVLFIDEAYALVNEGQNDYGKEAVATLIKRMEDDRDKLVLIVAGYTAEMKNFIDTNPGFKSRFNRYIEFKDYSAGELLQIYISQCSKLQYKLTEAAREKVQLLFENAYAQRDASFGNGRYVRNIFEKSLENQANRIAALVSLNKELLITIEVEDIPQGH